MMLPPYNVGQLAFMLRCGVRERDLLALCEPEAVNSYYKPRREPKFKSDGSVASKADGTIIYRDLAPCYGLLKLIQKRINARVLSQVEMPEYIQGSVRGRSNISNARFHSRNTFKLKTDLRNFFPSISYEMVYRALCGCGFYPDVSRVITRLVTFHGCVPQGAPTSSIIANIVFLPVDRILVEFCKSHSIDYTRYVDDIVASSNQDFKDLCSSILSTIVNAGFTVNHPKTGYNRKPDVTGVHLDKHGMGITSRLKEKIAIRENDPTLDPTPLYDYRDRVRRANFDNSSL